MTGWGRQSTETVVGGNDPHGGHRWVCEGGVRQGMVKVRLLCFRRLSPFLKLSLPKRKHTTMAILIIHRFTYNILIFHILWSF